MAAYDSQVIDRILPKLKQWEAVSGRRITPAMLESMMRAELGVEADRAQENAYRAKSLELSERGLALSEKAQKDAKSAAKANALIQIPTTAATLGLTYKALSTNAGGQTLLSSGGGATAAGVGGQTALATGTATGAATGTATEAGTMAAYDASLAAGAAEGVGSTAGTGTGSTAMGGAGVGGLIGLAITAGIYGPGLLKKATGMNDVWSKGLIRGPESFLGSAAGHIGGRVLSTIIDPVGRLGDAIADSVVCSELLRQGRISKLDRTKCIVFRDKYISDIMFAAYREWAEPHVMAMRRGGWRNWIRLPFAHAFVSYMVKMHHTTRIGWTKPTRLEKAVWNYAWKRCEKIAQRNEQFVEEVA